jgi:hypothetical protein
MRNEFYMCCMIFKSMMAERYSLGPNMAKMLSMSLCVVLACVLWLQMLLNDLCYVK